MANKTIVFIGFYQEKALGVRYLANAAIAAGYEPHVVLFKGFNSRTPTPASEEELRLLGDLLKRLDPFFIGLSVMSSLYLETVLKASAVARQSGATVGWGGVFATLVPERAAQECDMVLRGEGEPVLPPLLDCLTTGADWHDLPGLAYLKDGELVLNPMAPLEQDLDKYGYPAVGKGNYYFIERDKLKEGDPQLDAFTYELAASRGCPFQCSYCSSVCLRRLYPAQKYVRFRGVDNVMQELLEAKAQLPRARVVHFWDEIFSDDPNWVEEFARRYKAEINLPFRVWGHPLRVEEQVIGPLVKAGLHQIVVGIQSGSIHMRKDVFHRPESQEQILEAAAILDRCRVPRIVYDLMICHPFESPQDRKETFELCRKIPGRFTLEIHGLNFLPSTDIVGQALDEGLFTPEEMDSMLYSSLSDQYDHFWGPSATTSRNDAWSALIYLTQFPSLKNKLDELAALVDNGGDTSPIFKLRDKMEGRQRFADLKRKASLLLRLGR